MQIFKLLPFQYTISFPIKRAERQSAPRGEIVQGMFIQVLWIGIILGAGQVPVAAGHPALRGGRGLTCVNYCAKSASTSSSTACS